MTQSHISFACCGHVPSISPSIVCTNGINELPVDLSPNNGHRSAFVARKLLDNYVNRVVREINGGKSLVNSSYARGEFK